MRVDLERLPSDKAKLQNVIISLAVENEELYVQSSNLRQKQKILSEEKFKLSEKNKIIENKSIIIENENKKLVLHISQLEEQLKLLRSKQFGKSSEKVKHQIDNLEHSIEDVEISLGISAESLQEEKSNNEKNKAKRKKIPATIPREDIKVETSKHCCECGEESLRKIGEDTSEVLEYVPASFKVLRYIRPRYVCKKCEAMNQAYPVSKGIDKGKAGFGLLSHIMVQKYCNHLPLYRQSAMYERESIEISRSTMSGWLKQCCDLLNPLVEELRKTIFSANKLHGDDTPIKVLDKGGTKTKTGRIWTYVLDDRSCGKITSPAVCYYYSPDRKSERPKSHLQNFKGILQADAYAGYNDVYKTPTHPERNIYEAGCWAHVRRKFYEITLVSDNTKVAFEVIEQIRKLYKVEAEIRGQPPEERLTARQKHSKELIIALFDSFKKVLEKLSQKGATAKAIKYALNNEEALKRFLSDGKIEIDNNIAERALRSVAIGRKNWMFAGSDKGGEVAANIYSLIETAKLNNINPWKYLKKVLSVIQDYNSQKLSDLLPWNIQLE